MMPKVLVMRMALATLIGMPLIAILVDRYSDQVDLAGALIGYKPWYIQIGVGIVLGVLTGFGARWHIRRPYMRKVNVKYSSLLGLFQLTASEVWFVSFCAGVGEELLFRGAVQPFLGIFLTSVVFVGIHGYLHPFDWRLTTYGLLMTLFISLLGFAAAEVGLGAAIIAHVLIDVILLHNLQGYARAGIETDSDSTPNTSPHEQEE